MQTLLSVSTISPIILLLFGMNPLNNGNSLVQQSVLRSTSTQDSTTQITQTYIKSPSGIRTYISKVDIRLRFHLCNYACNVIHALVACLGATVCKRRGMRKMGAQGVEAR
jgi:hypothetical protein